MSSIDVQIMFRAAETGFLSKTRFLNHGSFSDLLQTEPDFKKYPQAIVGDTSIIYLIDRPEAQRATVQIGNRAIDARSPERYALAIDNIDADHPIIVVVGNAKVLQPQLAKIEKVVLIDSEGRVVP